MGYAEGYADAQANTGEIIYTYHVHEGNSSSNGGCYTIAVYHSHISSCYSDSYCNSQSWNSAGKCYTCGKYTNPDGNKSFCDFVTGSYLSCNKTTSTIESYNLGCGKTTSTIESATIIFD